METMADQEPFEVDTLYLVAVMKVHHELSRGNADGFVARLNQTLGELGIAHRTFEDYLSDHREDLLRTCREIGF